MNITLLDVVVAQGSSIFKLLAGEDQSLLIRRNAFLVLDLGLHILDGIRGFDLKSDGLAREGLYENLHLFGTDTMDLLEKQFRKGRKKQFACKSMPPSENEFCSLPDSERLKRTQRTCAARTL